MKRFLSLALAVLLSLSLSVSALAAEDTTPPLWEQWGFDSRQECIDAYFAGDESAYQAEVDDNLLRERWEAGMADEIAAFDADAYWVSDECWLSYGYLSKEEFMDEWLLSSQEEFYQCMLENWLDDRWMEYEESTRVARQRAALGAPAGQTGVMLDGTYLQFVGAAPEVRDGRTMVSCGPLLKAFGGTVGHEGGDVVCTLGGAVYRLRSGSDTVSVTAADGTASTISLGAACYEKNGVTYMALRPFAEAMGCDVLWDGVFDTAVLLRRDAIIDQLNQKFTVINRLLGSMVQDAEKNYKTVVDLNADVTLLDSINGDKRYSLGADMELLQSGAVVNFTATMDLTALLDMLEAEMDMFTPVERTAMRLALKNMKVQAIYDMEGGMAYLKMPALSLLSDGTYPADAWISMPVPTVETLDGMYETLTAGTLLYATEKQSVESGYWGDYYYEGMITPALLYQSIQDTSDTVAAAVGDDCFHDSGAYSVLHYGQDEYNAALEAEYGEGAAEWASDFEQLDAELKIARSGDATFRVVVQNKPYSYGIYGGDSVVLVDASGTITPAKMDMKLLVKVKNELNLSLRYTAATSVTTEQPVTAPPAGATIVDPDALYEGTYTDVPAA